MGLRIKIVENGRVVADYEDARGLIGVILVGDRIHKVCDWHASPVEVAQMVECLQEALTNVTEKHPDVVSAGKFLNTMRMFNEAMGGEKP